MNVQIQAVKFDADRKLIEFVEAKMAKLDRFIERATGADVILKLDKDNEKGNKVAIIRIEVPATTWWRRPAAKVSRSRWTMP